MGWIELSRTHAWNWATIIKFYATAVVRLNRAELNGVARTKQSWAKWGRPDEAELS